ncbi:MAG: PAS domain S-box protein, partial [Salinirussus sp.]
AVSSHLGFAAFTLFPLLVLMTGMVVSILRIREIGEYRLLVLVAILLLMSQHQAIEAWRFLRSGLAVGGASEWIETGANVLSSVAVYYGLHFAGRQQELAAELADSEQRYRTLTERSPIPILVHRDGEILFANDAAAAVFGAETGDELAALSVADLVHPEDREQFWAHHDDMLGNDDLHAAEHRCVGVDGETRQVVVAGGCAAYEGAEAAYLILRDVTREREFEASYERVERQYETTLQNTNDAIFLIDPEGDEILRANRRAAELLGYDRETLQGMSPHRIHPHEVDQFEAFVDGVRQETELRTDELSCLTSGGTEIPVEISASLVTVDGRDCVLASARDISERKRRSHQIDVLRRVLRHNLRNEMSVVIGFADTIAAKANDPSIREATERIVERASEMVSMSESIRRLQRVLEVSADGGTVDVRALVDEVADTYRESHPAATVEVRGPETLVAEGVAGLQWAVEQLVENAIEHNDGSEPRVSVSVSRTTTDAGQDRITVTVVDDGPGIPEGELASLDVDVEGTDVSHGSGLGLHVVGQIVTAAGGEVTVSEAEETGGAAVAMHLPTPTVPDAGERAGAKAD